MSDLNDSVINEFRANKGVVTEAMGGHFKDVRLVLLHHTGRRTGRELITPLLYIEDGDSFAVSGSYGGAEQDPLWVANVEAMAEAGAEVTIEVGERTVLTKATVLRDNAERDRLYQAISAYWPDMQQYETNTSRAFPMIRLDPVG